MSTILYKNELLHIEEEHLNHFNKYSWQIHVDSRSSTKYLYRCINGTTRKFHREILNCPAELTVDHIDGNGLNNYLSNLRIVTQKENSRNCRQNINNTSGITGVSYLRDRNRWFAQIKVDYKTINLGRFKTKEEAILARKEAERQYNFHDLHGSIKI